MDKIIQKAIEGGWLPLSYETVDYCHDGIVFESGSATYDDDYKESLSYKEITLDPLFWQAIGKACGWAEGADKYLDVYVQEWKYNALRFHEINLTEGFEQAVTYLQEVTTTKI